ncbi:MAG: hypothetical protein ACJ73S_00495 [Mycobacteriales bacterium]
MGTRRSSVLEIDVVSEPSISAKRSGHHLWEVDLPQAVQYDEALIKPALLIADRVRLISFRQDMWGLVHRDALINSRMPQRYIQNFAAVSLLRSRLDLEILDLRESDLCPVDEAREFLYSDREDHEIIPRLMDFAERYEDQIAQYREAYGRILRDRRDLLISPQLDAAEKAGVLETCLGVTTNVSQLSRWLGRTLGPPRMTTSARHLTMLLSDWLPGSTQRSWSLEQS